MAELRLYIILGIHLCWIKELTLYLTEAFPW